VRRAAAHAAARSASSSLRAEAGEYDSGGAGCDVEAIGGAAREAGIESADEGAGDDDVDAAGDEQSDDATEYDDALDVILSGTPRRIWVPGARTQMLRSTSA